MSETPDISVEEPFVRNVTREPPPQLQSEEIEILRGKLCDYQNKFSLVEVENESLRRIIERSNAENDELLQKLDSVHSSARAQEENANTLKVEVESLQQQNRSLRNSLKEMNSTRDDVVEKLKQVSFETRELIENCERASEETKIFKRKSEVSEVELRNTMTRNESLLQENESLRSKIQDLVLEMKSLVTAGVNNDYEAPTVDDPVSELIRRELIFSKQNCEKLRVELREKDNIIIKQSADFVDMKKRVDECHAEIVRLDAELKDCRARVSSLNTNLEMINAENLDLAEYTNFKRWHQKYAQKENIDELFSKLEGLHEIDELFDQKLAAHLDYLDAEHTIIEADANVNAIHRIKYYLERALFAIEKLTAKNLSLAVEHQSEILTKNEEIAKVKEILSHMTLYNEILEQTLKQCRENSKIDQFVEEKTDELITANKALLDNFEELRTLYRISHSCNGGLFAKYCQLNLCYKILKINLAKIPPTECGENANDEKTLPVASVLSNSSNALCLMNELFQEISEQYADFDGRTEDAQSIFNDYEVNLATKDYLRNTVDDMTQEVKRLTCRVEEEMAQKIREIESLRNEIDSMKIDNRELVNKIKNCNREIISLSTDNYDLNEKLTVLSEIEENWRDLKSELIRVQSKVNEYETHSAHSDPKSSCVENIKQVHRRCCELKENYSALRNDIFLLQENNNAMIGELKEHLRLEVPVLNVTERTTLLTLRNQCAEFKRQNNLLKETVHTNREQMLQEICSLKNIVGASCLLDIQNVDWNLNLNDLRLICERLKYQNNDTKHLDSLKDVNQMLEAADFTLSSKLRCLSDDFRSMETNLNAAIADKAECKRLLSSHCVAIIKIIRELKTLRESLSAFAEEVPKRCFEYNASLLKTIQEAISHTFNDMASSVALSNEEMIKEMQEMNLELKKRGETISALHQTVDESIKEKKNLFESLARQESLVAELKTEIRQLNSAIVERDSQIEKVDRELADLKLQFDESIREKTVESSNILATLEKMSTELRSKEETISALENEVSKSKEIQDGDVSSMGNISRTEEVSRLRDVEDSFEERYMKLRCIAVKMKKNIAELNQQLKNEKTERAAIQSKLHVALEQAKRSQALQEECDRITDDLDIKTKEIKELKKIIAEADKRNDEIRCQHDSLVQKTEALSKTNDAIEAEKLDVQVRVKNSTSQLENLKGEKFIQETLKNEKEKEIQLLKQKIKENEDYSRKILNDLEQAKLEARKQGALTLEMRDYEKTISDLSEKLRKKHNAVEELTEKLKISTESNVSFVERIKQLEEQITSYGASNKVADEQILNLNKIISAHEKNLEEKNISVKRLSQQLEEEKSKIEKLTLRLANSISEHDSLKALNKTKEQSLNNQLKSALNKVSILEESIKKKENEFEKLKEDFESYKIRAHNVLQKLRSPNNFKNNEEKLKIEIDNLSQTVKDLRKRLDDSLNDVDKHKTEIKLIDAVKEKLQSRLKDMNEAYAEKIKELDNIRIEFKSHKLNSETLMKCYKDEMEQLQNVCEKQKTDLEKMRTLNESVNNNVERNDNVAVKIVEPDADVSGYKENLQHSANETQKAVKSRTGKETLVREKNQNHVLVSLEKLLEDEDVVESRGEETELKKKLKLLENQVNYLNGILNESEKNAARNEQQVTLLKDEIRRLQKMIERAPHLQNGEYLKNVLFNFFTFPDGEEKCRLITILETLLQLSSEETETLSSIAKGYRVEQKRTSGSGLSSMLKLW